VIIQGDVFISGLGMASGRFWDGSRAARCLSRAKGCNAVQHGWKRPRVRAGSKGFGIWQFIRSESFQVVSLQGLFSIHAMDLSADGRWLISADQSGWHLWSITRKGGHIHGLTRTICRFLRRRRLGGGLDVRLDREVEVGTNGWDSPQGWSTGSAGIISWRGISAHDILPDGRSLIVAGHYRSMILELAAPERTVEFSKARARVSPAQPRSPMLVACAFAAKRTLWDAQTGRLLRHSSERQRTGSSEPRWRHS